MLSSTTSFPDLDFRVSDSSKATNTSTFQIFKPRFCLSAVLHPLVYFFGVWPEGNNVPGLQRTFFPNNHPQPFSSWFFLCGYGRLPALDQAVCLILLGVFLHAGTCPSLRKSGLWNLHSWGFSRSPKSHKGQFPEGGWSHGPGLPGLSGEGHNLFHLGPKGGQRQVI